MRISYDVQVSNICGGVTSTSATLTVNSPGLGDNDLDCDTDLSDFAQFPACMTGPDGGLLPDCELFDLDGDGDVDARDGWLFQAAFTGPGS